MFTYTDQSRTRGSLVIVNVDSVNSEYFCTNNADILPFYPIYISNYLINIKHFHWTTIKLSFIWTEIIQPKFIFLYFPSLILELIINNELHKTHILSRPSFPGKTHASYSRGLIFKPRPGNRTFLLRIISIFPNFHHKMLRIKLLY